jgi:hypothetical protein
MQQACTKLPSTDKIFTFVDFCASGLMKAGAQPSCKRPLTALLHSGWRVNAAENVTDDSEKWEVDALVAH